MGTSNESDRPFFRGGDRTSTVDVDRVLALLSDPQRRAILQFLASTPADAVEEEAIVDHVADRAPRGMDREEVRVECYHRHLPKLRAAGLIERDRRMGDVRYDRNEAIERILDTIAGLED